MAYKVLVEFVDLLDNRHKYRVGDTFPHSGGQVSKSRIAELSGRFNKAGVPLIRECPSEATEDHVDVKTAVSPTNTSKAKGRPRKGQGRRARTDS